MIRNEQKIIILAVIAGVSLWIVDAVIDSAIFGSGPFLTVLLEPGHERYLRSLFLLSFIAFGFLVSRLMSRWKGASEALKESEAKYRSLVESTEDSIYLVDKDCRYLFLNKKHMSRLGLMKERLIGQPYSEFHSENETAYFVEKINNVFNSGESSQYEHRSQRDGKFFIQTFSPVKDSEGKTIAVTVVSKNITERKQMEEALRALSLTDELTGLYNRRGFMALADQHLKIANRVKTGFYMLYADLDNLKSINDTFGHKEGDMALIAAANILRESFRESDIISRIGGDEFVIFPVVTTEVSVEVIKTRLQKNLDLHNAVKARGYELSLSVGIPYYDPEKPLSLEELLAQGDKLMYAQKKLKQKPV